MSGSVVGRRCVRRAAVRKFGMRTAGDTYYVEQAIVAVDVIRRAPDRSCCRAGLDVTGEAPHERAIGIDRNREVVPAVGVAQIEVELRGIAAAHAPRDTLFDGSYALVTLNGARAPCHDSPAAVADCRSRRRNLPRLPARACSRDPPADARDRLAREAAQKSVRAVHDEVVAAVRHSPRRGPRDACALRPCRCAARRRWRCDRAETPRPRGPVLTKSNRQLSPPFDGCVRTNNSYGNARAGRTPGSCFGTPAWPAATARNPDGASCRAARSRSCPAASGNAVFGLLKSNADVRSPQIARRHGVMFGSAETCARPKRFSMKRITDVWSNGFRAHLAAFGPRRHDEHRHARVRGHTDRSRISRCPEKSRASYRRSKGRLRSTSAGTAARCDRRSRRFRRS